MIRQIRAAVHNTRDSLAVAVYVALTVTIGWYWITLAGVALVAALRVAVNVRNQRWADRVLRPALRAVQYDEQGVERVTKSVLARDPHDMVIPTHRKAV
jgi:signal transduction histidine kinase